VRGTCSKWTTNSCTPRFRAAWMQDALWRARVKEKRRQRFLRAVLSSQVLHKPAKFSASRLEFSIDESYAHISFDPGCGSPRAAPSDTSSSRGSSPGIDDEERGVLLEQPVPEIRRGRDTLVRTSLIILVSLLVTGTGCWTWSP
jgi:hypothetical protein